MTQACPHDRGPASALPFCPVSTRGEDSGREPGARFSTDTVSAGAPALDGSPPEPGGKDACRSPAPPGLWGPVRAA